MIRAYDLLEMHRHTQAVEVNLLGFEVMAGAATLHVVRQEEDIKVRFSPSSALGDLRTYTDNEVVSELRDLLGDEDYAATGGWRVGSLALGDILAVNKNVGAVLYDSKGAEKPLNALEVLREIAQKDTKLSRQQHLEITRTGAAEVEVTDKGSSNLTRVKIPR